MVQGRAQDNQPPGTRNRTPMIIPADEFKSAIRSVFGSVQFPRVPRSSHVYVPSVDFIRNEWHRYWQDLIDRRGLREISASNNRICEQFAGMAVAEMNLLVLRKMLKERTPEDVNAAIVEAHVSIGAGSKLNGVSLPAGQDFGNHATCILGVTANGRMWEPYFWEPQNYEPQLTTISAARMDFVHCSDALF